MSENLETLNAGGQPYRRCVLVPVGVGGAVVGFAVRHDGRPCDESRGEFVAYLPEKFFRERGL